MIVAASASASTQLTPAEASLLRGVTKAKVRVTLDGHADECGVRKDSLALAAARPMVDARLTIDEYAVVKIRVGVIALQETIGERSVGCSVALQLQAVTLAQDGRLIHQLVKLPEDFVVDVELWSNAQILAGPESDIGARVSDAVRRARDEFATKVKMATIK